MIAGPEWRDSAQCEAVLRSLPDWFGIEESLRMYARNTESLPTFVWLDGGVATAFLSLRQHFAAAWEIDCIAVHANARGTGLGRMLLERAERWLLEQGAELLQVKTIAASKAHAGFAQTRQFYERSGFLPLEVFPELWSRSNPCLLMVKILQR